MTRHQCYCYGVIAIQNMINDSFSFTDKNFYDELNYLWCVYSEKAIEQKYRKMKRNKQFDNLDWD